MKAKTITCLITLGPMAIISKCVWAWEAEVLKEKFGGSCEFNETGEANISELPDAGSEFSRLESAHGVDEETKVSHVVNTFGRGMSGLKELEKAIKASEVNAKSPKPVKVPEVKTAPKSKKGKPGPKVKVKSDTAEETRDPLE